MSGPLRTRGLTWKTRGVTAMTFPSISPTRRSVSVSGQDPPRNRTLSVMRRGVIGMVGAGLACGIVAAPASAVDPHCDEGASTINSSSSGNAILDAARQYVGVPYVWGGSTPAGFDCSGFTMHVFAQVGIYLPRTSGEQRYAGYVVPAAEARPGDLIWWPGHVAIYTGNGNHIAARAPGTLLHESPIWRAGPTFIRVG